MAKGETEHEVQIGIPKDLKLTQKQLKELEKKFENQLVEVMEAGKGEVEELTKPRTRTKVRVKRQIWVGEA